MTLNQLSSEEQRVLSCVKSGSALYLIQFLAEEDPVLRDAIRGRKFGLGISVAGGLKRSIRIEGDRIRLVDGSLSGTGVVFRFPEPAQLNNLLSGVKAKMFPLLKSFSAGKIIKDFQIIMGRLPVYLNPEETLLKEKFDFITRLLMLGALRGVKEVAENDAYVEPRVKKIPDGVISLQVEGRPEFETRIIKEGKRLTIVPEVEADAGKPNALLTFKDVETAYNLFTGRISAVVALGSSDVKIRGRIPMIQNLFPVLDRVSWYMAITKE